MASKAPTSNAAPAATHHGWRRLGRNLPTLEKKEESLFLDARLPAHEQAKNIVFKYSSDGDVLYHTACSSVELLKKQTSAPAALESESSNSSSDCCTTESNTDESLRRSVDESRSITLGRDSDAHMGSGSTVASGGEVENIHRSQDIQEHEESEVVSSKTTQEELTRSESRITQCVDRNRVRSSNEESPLEIKKFPVDTGHSTSNTEEARNVGVASISYDRTSNKNDDEAEVTYSGQSGWTTADLRHIRDSVLSASSETGLEEELVENVDTDATQHSGSASPADTTLASTTTVAGGGQQAYAEISKTTVTNLLPFRKGSEPSEHVHRAEQKEVKENVRLHEKGDSDDDIETALFKDDAAWEWLIADLAQFRVK